MTTRIDKDNYYLKIAESVALRSNCLSAVIGAVIIRDDQIVSTGYVGAPRKTKDCMQLNYCIRRRNNVKSGTGYEMCRSVHAEMNAIINAARAGVSVLNGDLYLHASIRTGEGGLRLVKAHPCLMCKKMIVNAGIKRFIGHDENGNLSISYISDWIDRWAEIEDISKDDNKYESDYSDHKDVSEK
ncbi:hypothetical protein EOL94_03620 [bacterium]|nr:hypothetical protein [bacterium]